MSIIAITPFAFATGIGIMIAGSAVTIPLATRSWAIGEYYSSVDELFSRLGCTTLTEGKKIEKEENVHLCYFSSSRDRGFPKLKLFYSSGKINPERIVRIKKVQKNSLQGDISMFLESGKVITKNSDDSLIKSWINYEREATGKEELLPEDHCIIISGQGPTRNLYNFFCRFLKNEDSNNWVSKADPFQLKYTLEKE